MQLSRERKAIIAVLGLALGGLTIDRVFLSSGVSGPSSAQAAPVTDGGNQFAVPATTAAPEAPAPAPLRPAALVATRLEQYAEQHNQPTELADIFQPSASWIETAPPVETATPGRTELEEFKARHRLTAIMLSGAQPSIIVDGKCLRLNQTLDGHTLIAVTERTARFERDGRQVELTLLPPELAGADKSAESR